MFFMWSDTSREENIRTVGTSSKDLVNVSSSTLPAEAAKISNGQMRHSSMLLSRQRSQKCREIIWETFKKKEETGEQRRGVSVRSRLLSHKYRLFKKKERPTL
jgi:hypothetical protein